MRIGIGIPNIVLEATGDRLLEWARRAEARGFSSLATIDRLAFPTYDSLVSLAAAAGATERIGLLTNVLLGPLYRPAQLAKATASLAQLSMGRFTLGVGVGTRADDYELAEASFGDRGSRFDDLLEYLHRAWRGEVEPAVGPRAPGGAVPLLVGGRPQHAAPRAVRWNAGWTIGGGGSRLAAQGAEAFRAAWRELGGDGEPRIVALNYFSLGEDAAQESERNLRSYYGHLDEWVERIARDQPRDEAAIRETAKAFEGIGVDELIFDPTTADPEQVDRLADIVL